MRTKEKYIPFGEDHPGALKIRERLPFLLILKWAQENSKGYAETIREMFEEYETFPFEDETELKEFDEKEVELYFITNKHELLESRHASWNINPLENRILTTLPKARMQNIASPFPDLGSLSFIVGEEIVSRIEEKAKAEDLTRDAFLKQITTVYDIRRRVA